MNEQFITINNNNNNNKIELEKGGYVKRNSDSVLLAGFVFHSIEHREDLQKKKTTLNINAEDRAIILGELENIECWLFPAITAMGELIVAANTELLEDDTPTHVSLLVSALTELLY